MKAYGTWIFNIAWSDRCVAKARRDKLQEIFQTTVLTKHSPCQSVSTVQLLFRRVLFFLFNKQRRRRTRACWHDWMLHLPYFINMETSECNLLYYFVRDVRWGVARAWPALELLMLFTLYLFWTLPYSLKISPCAQLNPLYISWSRMFELFLLLYANAISTIKVVHWGLSQFWSFLNENISSFVCKQILYLEKANH